MKIADTSFQWKNLGAFLILVGIKVDGADLMTQNYYGNGARLECQISSVSELEERWKLD